MSNISTAYTAIRTVMAATLTQHTELANPYFISKEADLIFTKGWAVGLGPGFNTNRNVGCQLSIQRDFVITVTRKLFNTDRDISGRVTVEENLCEDHYLIIKALEQSPVLNASTSGIAKILYVQDGGLEFIRTDRLDLIMFQLITSVEYFEII